MHNFSYLMKATSQFPKEQISVILVIENTQLQLLLQIYISDVGQCNFPVIYNLLDLYSSITAVNVCDYMIGTNLLVDLYISRYHFFFIFSFTFLAGLRLGIVIFVVFTLNIVFTLLTRLRYMFCFLLKHVTYTLKNHIKFKQIILYKLQIYQTYIFLENLTLQNFDNQRVERS